MRFFFFSDLIAFWFFMQNKCLSVFLDCSQKCGFQNIAAVLWQRMDNFAVQCVMMLLSLGLQLMILISLCSLFLFK